MLAMFIFYSDTHCCSVLSADFVSTVSVTISGEYVGLFYYCDIIAVAVLPWNSKQPGKQC